jgi:hypothetical protein
MSTPAHPSMHRVPFAKQQSTTTVHGPLTFTTSHPHFRLTHVHREGKLVGTIGPHEGGFAFRHSATKGWSSAYPTAEAIIGLMSAKPDSVK